VRKAGLAGSSAAAAAYWILKVYDRCRMWRNVKIDSAFERAGRVSARAAGEFKGAEKRKPWKLLTDAACLLLTL
jgi:hypothetical protein